MNENFTSLEILKAIQGKYENENKLFCERNEFYIKLIPRLSEATNIVFSQITASGNWEITIYLLGRICIRHYESIVLLCSLGFGFRAMAIHRTFFEKAVDSFYLNQNPNELDNFIDFGLVQLKKTGFENWAKTIEPDLVNKIKKFKDPKKKRLRPTWSDKDVIKRAISVGVNDNLINLNYRIPNEYIHSSIGELQSSIFENTTGNIEPIESDNEQERKVAAITLTLSTRLVIEVLRNQVACFGLQNCQILDDLEDEIEKYSQSK